MCKAKQAPSEGAPPPPPPPNTGMSSGARASLTGGITEGGSEAKRKLVSDASVAGPASLLQIGSWG